jgi:hypothetical protein
MSDNSDTTDAADDSPNISRLRQMAIKGDEYREAIDFTYYGMEGELYIRPLTDEEFLPIAAFLEDRLDIDPEEAQEKLEDGHDEDDNTIDPGQFDDEFVAIMKEAAVMGIDTESGLAAGETEEGVREILGATDGDEDIGLQGGKTLVIAEKVLEVSSDADSAEAFRRDGGGG